MSQPGQRELDINWDKLQLPTIDLQFLDEPFTEDDLKRAVFQMPSDKAPGLDGFTGAFFKNCWEIIKTDIIEAANAFHNMQNASLSLINTANIVLLPKKEGAG